MNATTLINDARTTLHDHQHPDSREVSTALLTAARLAEHTAATTTDHHEATCWDFCAAALNEALNALPTHSDHRAAVSVNADAFLNVDLEEVTAGLSALIDQLRQLLRHASTDPSEPQQQRQTWAVVAVRLEQAAADLP